MGFDPSVRSEEVFVGEDRSWALMRKGFDSCRTIMLDVSTFAAAHFTDKGAIPSGTALTKLANDMYGPYTGLADTNETQTITRTATAGTFDFTFDGITAAGISAAAAVTAAVIQAAFDAVGLDDIVVTGSAGGPFTLTFGGKYAETNVPMAEITDDGTGGTVVIAAGTAGSGFAGLLFSAVKVGKGDGSDLASAADVAATLFWEGVVSQRKLPVFAGTNNGEVDGDAINGSRNQIRWEA